ncbi:hypothetical protein T492DRAFT_914812, partial [Pavlovales sp. CCMP2436]
MPASMALAVAQLRSPGPSCRCPWSSASPCGRKAPTRSPYSRPVASSSSVARALSRPSPPSRSTWSWCTRACLGSAGSGSEDGEERAWQYGHGESLYLEGQYPAMYRPTLLNYERTLER